MIKRTRDDLIEQRNGYYIPESDIEELLIHDPNRQRRQQMPVKLNKENENNALKMCDLKKGQLAEIIDTMSSERGDIIQRINEDIIFVGKNAYYYTSNSTLKVRLLEPGETITITSNGGEE